MVYYIQSFQRDPQERAKKTLKALGFIAQTSFIKNTHEYTKIKLSKLTF